MVDRLFRELHRAIERTPAFRGGRKFAPRFLRGKRLSRAGFRPAIGRMANALGLRVREQKSNPFPPDYKIGWERQIVDYRLARDGIPQIFLEVETLDRSQLSTFMDPPAMGGRHSLNKLWYYYVTLGERRIRELSGPRIFAFLLVLPDQPVGHYQVWDKTREYGFFHPKIAPLIHQNPFRFYDPLIKAAARRFLAKKEWFPKDRSRKRWDWLAPQDLQGLCELVIFTLTSRELILSRGRHGFAPERERRMPLRWRR